MVVFDAIQINIKIVCWLSWTMWSVEVGLSALFKVEAVHQSCSLTFYEVCYCQGVNWHPHVTHTRRLLFSGGPHCQGTAQVLVPEKLRLQRHRCWCPQREVSVRRFRHNKYTCRPTSAHPDPHLASLRTRQLFHQRCTQPPSVYSTLALSGQRPWTGGPSHPSLVDKALWLPGLRNTHTHADGTDTRVHPHVVSF